MRQRVKCKLFERECVICNRRLGDNTSSHKMWKRNGRPRSYDGINEEGARVGAKTDTYTGEIYLEIIKEMLPTTQI